MTSEFPKIVTRADRLQAQHGLPHFCNLLFDFITRRNENTA